MIFSFFFVIILLVKTFFFSVQKRKDKNKNSEDALLHYHNSLSIFKKSIYFKKYPKKQSLKPNYITFKLYKVLLFFLFKILPSFSLFSSSMFLLLARMKKNKEKRKRQKIPARNNWNIEKLQMFANVKLLQKSA